MDYIFNQIGSYLAYPFNLSAYYINNVMSTVATYVDSAINLLGSIAGGGIAVAGLLAGALSGLAFGILLSIQLFWTNQPLTFPMTLAFNAALYAACCEMNSVNQIHRLLHADNNRQNKTKNRPEINVINVADDEVIGVEAALNTGLGSRPGAIARDDEKTPLIKKINTSWFRSGGHGGTPTDKIHPKEDNDRDLSKKSGFPKRI